MKLLGIIFTILIIVMLVKCDDLKDKSISMSNHIGDTIIIQNDTLVIVNYDLFNYKLNNGLMIDEKLFSKK
jgi:hypothetical protein